jgi:hypothetical protein
MEKNEMGGEGSTYGEERLIQGFGGEPEGKKPLGRGVDGRIILRWVFRLRDVGAWTGSRWLRIGTSGEQRAL